MVIQKTCGMSGVSDRDDRAASAFQESVLLLAGHPLEWRAEPHPTKEGNGDHLSLGHDAIEVRQIHGDELDVGEFV
jgi:hypothetical protein